MKLTEWELIKDVVLKTIPNKWTLDLNRVKNHNFVILVELQNVLKPIEEADESEHQDSLKLKQKPTFGRNKNDRRRRNNPFKKNGHNYDWKDCPDNNYGNTYRGHKSHAIQEKQRYSNQEREITIEERHESDMIK